MLSLIYISTILVLNQSLYVLINAQQDLKVNPNVWNNPTNQLPSKNYHPTIDNYSHQKASFSSYYNYNQLNPNAVPILNSYYESIIPIAIHPGQSSSYNKPNWEDIREGRSTPIKPPVELHHGYRYNTPAISFPNIAHLKNVLYNDLGLDKNPNNFPSSPHGFEVQQTEEEIPNNVYFGTQKPSSETKILTHETNFKDHKNTQNITILTPVKNATFTYHYNQPNVFDHKKFTHENNKNKCINETSSKYSEDHNSTFNIKTSPSAQIFEHIKTENKIPETSFKSDNLSQEKIDSNFSKYSVMQERVEATTDSSNIRPSQNELTLNITPSKKLLEHIQPGKVINDIPANVAQTEFNKYVSEVNNNKIFKYDYFGKPFVNQQTVESPHLMPAITSFSGHLNVKPDIQTTHIDGTFAQESSNNPINLSEYQQHFPNSEKQHMPIQSLPHVSGLSNEQLLYNISPKPDFAQESENNPIRLSEYQQHFPNSQKQHTTTQSLPNVNGLLNEQSSPKPANRPTSLDKYPSRENQHVKNNNLNFQQLGDPSIQQQQNNFSKPPNQYTSLDKYSSGENQQYNFIEPGVISNVKNNNLNFQQLGNPSIQHQQNKVFSLDENLSKPPNQYTSLDKYPSGENQQYTFIESGVSSNVKNNNLNFQQLGNLFIQQNKVSNSGLNRQNHINEDMSIHSTPDSKRHNQIVFPTNFVLISPTNFVTRVPTYPNIKTRDDVGLNIQKGYPEYNHRAPSYNIQEKNNSSIISGGSDINEFYPVPHLQQNNIINQNKTDSNQLTNFYTYIAKQRPTIAFNNEYINPRTANYQTESTNYTPTKAQIVEFPVFNTTNKYNLPQQNVQSKTSIVFPTNKKLRSPHLVYGSPF